MIDEKELTDLERMSGFKIEAHEKEEILSAMNEIIEIMDRINGFEAQVEYGSQPVCLSKLRDDVPAEDSPLSVGDVSVARVVQSDD